MNIGRRKKAWLEKGVWVVSSTIGRCEVNVMTIEINKSIHAKQ